MVHRGRRVLRLVQYCEKGIIHRSVCHALIRLVSLITRFGFNSGWLDRFQNKSNQTRQSQMADFAPGTPVRNSQEYLLVFIVEHNLVGASVVVLRSVLSPLRNSHDAP